MTIVIYLIIFLLYGQNNNNQIRGQIRESIRQTDIQKIWFIFIFFILLQLLTYSSTRFCRSSRSLKSDYYRRESRLRKKKDQMGFIMGE
jgi:hypothetical protein